MKIYKIANGVEQKSLRWECPVTGIYIVSHFEDDNTLGYELYHKDDSFIDIFDNFYHAANWAKKHLDPKCNISKAGKRIAKSNKIYKIAQMSSIMYYVESSPNEILLTPNPDMAKHEDETVPAFVLPSGEYFSSDTTMLFSEVILKKLKDKGYMGAIDGDYIHMFYSKALKPLGEYNFISRKISRK